jgi:Malic enzyme, N-terminal domain
VLFYRLLTEHISEMLPIVYTPTVGTAIERYSLEYGRPRGVYLSVDHSDQVETAFRNYGLGRDDVDLIVATDAEAILGIGDWGVGGIAISVGKLALYVTAAGLHPRRVIPVVLDAGTDNRALLDDPMYLGSRYPRMRGERYDQLIDAYVTVATRLFPNALLHGEDFGAANAHRILTKYAGTCCTFNDDIQGTAAVVLAAALSATRAAGTPIRDQTVVIYGRHRRDRDRRHAAAGDDHRRPARRRGHQPVLHAGQQGPAHQRLSGDDARLPGSVRPAGRRSRRLAARRRRRYRPSRGRGPRPPHYADRDLGSARGLLRGDRH